MNKPLAQLLASSVILALFNTYGCNGDDDDDSGTAGTGGTSARGGRGGSSGKAGTSAKGGNAGEGAIGGSAGRGGTSGTGGASGGRGGTNGTTEGGNAGEPQGGAATAMGGEAGDAASLLARGEYLVEHVSACVDCHTPRNADGTPDMTRKLGGNPTFIDLVPEDNTTGLIPSPNLTPDASGLRDWTDAQIKNAFLNGLDASGQTLHPIMPYAVFHNMTAEDANAIVAYLRSVAPVSATIPERQPQATPPSTPAVPIPETSIPATTLATSNENYARAQRGRYLASTVSDCMECHTPEAPPGSAVLDTTRLFAGGRVFVSAALGLPVPPYPAQIMTPNLTPDATGSATLTVDDIVRAIRNGVDDDGTRLCPPMPAGPMKPFAGITEDDAMDIAIYLKSIAPVVSTGITECTPPEEGGGGASAAGGNGAGGN
jgi:mono/diheme cytochrome c family protein